MVSAMIVSMSEPPTDEEIDDVLDSLAQMNGGEMDGAMEAVMASYGAKFIPYKNLQDNAAVDLSQFANVTPLYKFGELLGLVKL
jgi:hypothetical protein